MQASHVDPPLAVKSGAQRSEQSHTRMQAPYGSANILGHRPKKPEVSSLPHLSRPQQPLPWNDRFGPMIYKGFQFPADYRGLQHINVIMRTVTGLMNWSPGMPSVHDTTINQQGHTVICIVQMGKLRLGAFNSFALVTYLQQTGLKGWVCIISIAIHENMMCCFHNDLDGIRNINHFSAGHTASVILLHLSPTYKHSHSNHVILWTENQAHLSQNKLS